MCSLIRYLSGHCFPNIFLNPSSIMYTFNFRSTKMHFFSLSNESTTASQLTGPVIFINFPTEWVSLVSLRFYCKRRLLHFSVRIVHLEMWCGCWVRMELKPFFLKKCNQVENIWMDFVDEDKKPKFSTFRAGFLMCLPRILLNDL